MFVVEVATDAADDFLGDRRTVAFWNRATQVAHGCSSSGSAPSRRPRCQLRAAFVVVLVALPGRAHNQIGRQCQRRFQIRLESRPRVGGVAQFGSSQKASLQHLGFDLAVCNVVWGVRCAQLEMGWCGNAESKKITNPSSLLGILMYGSRLRLSSQPSMGFVRLTEPKQARVLLSIYSYRAVRISYLETRAQVQYSTRLKTRVQHSTRLKTPEHFTPSFKRLMLRFSVQRR